MPAFKVGVSLQPQHTTIADLRRAWCEADQLGLDSIWVWDHFFPLHGNPRGPHFEAWTLLAAMAVDTSQAMVGVMVSSAGYRNPDLLAHMAMTVDHLSGGRAAIGLGAGWFERDYREFGYEFGTAGDRLRTLRAALERIRARRPKLQPKPLGRLPLVIGGGGEKVTLRLVAEHADIWNGFGPASAYRHRVSVLHDWCAKVGRDPSQIELSANMRDPAPRDVEAMVAAGCGHVICSTSHPYDLGPAREALRLARGG